MRQPRKRASESSGRAEAGRDPRRKVPSLDRLLESERVRGWEERWGRDLVKEALRSALDAERDRLLRAGGGTFRTGRVLEMVEEKLEAAERPSLRRVLNATGVVLHTNLGRAPLAPMAVAAMEVGARYSNLEYDVELGARGSRYDHCDGLLRELTGAEAALVVNNNAAAVALMVNEFAAGRQVVVSRGELVEIGGSFRLPDIVRRAGAELVEVGTTNRTREADYREAIGPRTGLVLKVHPSNYRLVGFTEEVPLSGVAAICRTAGVPVAHDLGSGLLRPELLPEFPPEPGVRASLDAGADVVSWSGDKLLGGPQAGVLLGRGEAVARLRRNPLLRAFRVDKGTLAALEATLRLYRDPEQALREVPVLRALAEPVEQVEARAGRALARVRFDPPARVQVRRMKAVVGGGAFPGLELPSAGWMVEGLPPEEIESRCRAGTPPLIGRVSDDRFWLDFRTLLPGEEGEAAEALQRALRAEANEAEANE